MHPNGICDELWKNYSHTSTSQSSGFLRASAAEMRLFGLNLARVASCSSLTLERERTKLMPMTMVRRACLWMDYALA